MGLQRSDNKAPSDRGILARPLDALVFLIPLMAFYQIVAMMRPAGLSGRSDHVIAFDLILRVLELFGPFGAWAPPAMVTVILLATQSASGMRWSIKFRRVGWLYIEALLLALPLLALNWAVPMTGVLGISTTTIDQLALGVGAGVYEEMVFRLIFITVLMMVGVDILRLKPSSVAIVAVVVSALVFAAHHHKPIGVEVFDMGRFSFRTVAGLYLAGVFWFRGYGSAAGCHAAYNVALVTLFRAW